MQPCLSHIRAHTHTHATYSCGHMTNDPPQLFTHAKAEWVFLRSAIIPSECRLENYLVGTPSTPISHSPHSSSQWEIKQKYLDRTGTNTSKPFCLSHLGTTNGFSSYSRLKMYAYLQQHSSLFPNIMFILWAIKWPCICPCRPHPTNLPFPAFDDTRDMKWCSLITCHTVLFRF